MTRQFSTASFATISLAVVLFSSAVNAETGGVETSFTYSGLYKSIKTAAANDYSQIALNFYLLENRKEKNSLPKKDRVCPIEGVPSFSNR